MLTITCANPPSAIGCLLATGTVQVPGLKWACVVTAVHNSGIPKSVTRFAIRLDDQGATIGL
jgi:hypothetical protein